MKKIWTSKDGSIKTEYTKELSELLPLINFWLMPSVFLATEEELHHKYHFVKEVLAYMGLPLYDDDMTSFTEKFITDIARFIVWKFYIETGTVHVCTGSDWFDSHICRNIVCCYNPDHSFVTAWRHLGGQTESV